MPLPEFVARHVDKLLVAFCDNRVPPHVSDKIRLMARPRGSRITQFVTRTAWSDPSTKWTVLPVGRLDLSQAVETGISNVATATSVGLAVKASDQPRACEDLLDEADRNPTEIFWG